MIHAPDEAALRRLEAYPAHLGTSLATSFLQDSQGIMAILDADAEQGPPERLAWSAQLLRRRLEPLDVKGILDVVGTVERLAEQGHVTQARHLLPAVRHDVQQLRDLLRRYCCRVGRPSQDEDGTVS